MAPNLKIGTPTLYECEKLTFYHVWWHLYVPHQVLQGLLSVFYKTHSKVLVFSYSTRVIVFLLVFWNKWSARLAQMCTVIQIFSPKLHRLEVSRSYDCITWASPSMSEILPVWLKIITHSLTIVWSLFESQNWPLDTWFVSTKPILVINETSNGIPGKNVLHVSHVCWIFHLGDVYYYAKYAA